MAASGTPEGIRASLRTHRTRVQLVLQEPDDHSFCADVTPDVGFGPMGMVLRVLEVLATLDVHRALSWADEAAVVVGDRVHQGAPEFILGDDELRRAAHLHRPWPLEFAARLGLRESPRTMEDVVPALHRAGHTSPSTAPTTKD